MNGSNFRNW